MADLTCSRSVTFAALTAFALFLYFKLRQKKLPRKKANVKDVGTESPDAEIDIAFTRAQNFLKDLVVEDTGTKLQLYGLFKRATCGTCNHSRKPSVFDLRAKAKYDAWSAVSNLSEAQAKQEYVRLVESLRSSPAVKSPNPLGPSTSTLGVIGTQKMDWENKEGILFNAQAGDTAEVEKLVNKKGSTVLQEKDEDGLTALHWACDRGHIGTVVKLVSLRAEIDAQDDDLLTPLAYAVISGHEEIACFLVEKGADFMLKDNSGEAIIDMASKDLQQKLRSVSK
mmetsp:Transcript_11293/g.12942  ORF Transcript_11293/g.12942 Transcript_11293/m.12942 type:complete len:282 (+) Transcript_11293:67-912(+)